MYVGFSVLTVFLYVSVVVAVVPFTFMAICCPF